jgi:flavocytochrome c
MPTNLRPVSALTQLCVTLVLAVNLLSCTSTPPQQVADVIVVGAGIAGLSAALEASAAGARVVVIEANSVGGGHAVKAGGLAMVDTPLQRARGIQDSADLAVRDLYRWGKDPDPYWSRYYAEHSADDVYNWLTQMDVQFKVILHAPETSVPRFHFTRGTAVNVVVPMLRKALNDPNIQFAWNTRVTAMAKARGKIVGVFTRNERDGTKNQWHATSTILTTGGFQNNLDMVRANWPADRAQPARLYTGAGQFATGDGYRLAEWAGADMQNLDRQVTFFGGVPDPADPSGNSALYVENPAAIWLAADGRRFINEAADSKAVAARVSQLPDMSYWLIFDSRGRSRLNVRDALLLDRKLTRAAILDDPELTATAASLQDLAHLTGLPEHGLRTSVQVWNRMVQVGTDFQHGRFNGGKQPTHIRAINTPPYFAIKVFPLTRKSMGGPAINIHAQVLDSSRVPIPGLYAAGELTGVAGINGQHGGAGTFLGPSVLLGRVAGRSAAGATAATGNSGNYAPLTVSAQQDSVTIPDFGQAGYWHYDSVHQYASAKAYTCERCHAGKESLQMAYPANAMLSRLNSCTGCH